MSGPETATSAVNAMQRVKLQTVLIREEGIRRRGAATDAHRYGDVLSVAHRQLTRHLPASTHRREGKREKHTHVSGMKPAEETRVHGWLLTVITHSAGSHVLRRQAVVSFEICENPARFGKFVPVMVMIVPPAVRQPDVLVAVLTAQPDTLVMVGAAVWRQNDHESDPIWRERTAHALGR
mgnify:CR=1 FL=1